MCNRNLKRSNPSESVCLIFWYRIPVLVGNVVKCFKNIILPKYSRLLSRYLKMPLLFKRAYG
jgi:hypothetical protein